MLLKRLFSRSRLALPVRSVYEAIVARARQPGLYTTAGVPDTLDGRYDMIVLHVDAVMTHLQQGAEADKAFAQELIDEVFRDMDRSLREMGVGDMGVGKRVKKMATVYYGRANAYAGARAEGQGALEAALLRNVFAGDEANAANARVLAAYADALHRAMAGLDRDEIRAGKLQLPEIRLSSAS
jgi:cytochrome b pre-mRNA-processing protein 3